ncbi:glycine cleavage system aminomethyltransferase GcvT [Corynebacterium uterequi]|uniref:Aminomethyltransferase n=1 Tax=Corynebacterium uterequi TaxID=1072256 RepID=A0A0G3HDR2_9CORY|nr:glycine cleavage system aminomethyltransferase GcvT [Corynebacterium uterequi]AKK11506.1 glycine cleavage system T protein [Corynebacterium uterequi]
MTELLASPLHSVHEDLGATFTPFGAWNMPLKYGKELDEHRAVRSRVGLFDLSHMGEIRVTGADAGAYLDYVLISMLSTAAVGQAKYSMIAAEDGGIIDDLISYRLGDEEFLVVPNASNTDVVWQAMNERLGDFDVTIANESTSTALVAVQGPDAEATLLKIVDADDHAAITDMRYYRCAPVVVAGVKALVARTGYTGEDGFEIFVPNADAATVWHAAAEAGAEFDIIPCGLAARDSLRLEAAMPLYGNELGLDITPLDAGMGRAFAKKEADFVGKAALAGKEQEFDIVPLASEQRRAARAGAEVFVGEEKVGVVTSGLPSPTLGHPIALVRAPFGRLAEGDAVEVDIRGKRYPFTVVPRPFYSRSK